MALEIELAVGVDAARAGAEVIRSWYDRGARIELKGEVDPVSEADREAEAAIVSIIRGAFADDTLVTEESGEHTGKTQRTWFVDPLDGTVNFLHNMPHVGVAIALYVEDDPAVAITLDVFRDELFTASAGEGAAMNGASIAVTDRRLSESLVVTGFPYDRRKYAYDYAASMAAVIEVAQGVRRVGSAALDFAWVAAGRYDGFWEFSLAPWDVAPGILLVEEAGGVVVDLEGNRLQPGGKILVAGGPELVADLRPLVSANLPPHLESP